jgi:hypothetical protein
MTKKRNVRASFMDCSSVRKHKLYIANILGSTMFLPADQASAIYIYIYIYNFIFVFFLSREFGFTVLTWLVW